MRVQAGGSPTRKYPLLLRFPWMKGGLERGKKGPFLHLVVCAYGPTPARLLARSEEGQLARLSKGEGEGRPWVQRAHVVNPFSLSTRGGAVGFIIKWR